MREENFKAPVGAAQAIPFSVFTSEAGHLTKTYRRAPSGAVEKLSGAQLYKGRVEIVEVHCGRDLIAALSVLTSCQAVGWGVPKVGRATVAAKTDIDKGTAPEGAIARTKENFKWHDGPGVLMLDHDSGPNDGAAWGVDKVLGALCAAVPGLRDAPMVVGASASASVRMGRVAVSDAGKCRVYVLVKQAGLIPRFGARLCELLWSNGHGWYAVSKSGAQLDRCLVDAAVWSPERLDFAGPVVVGEGLDVADRGWRVINDGAPLLDLQPLVLRDDAIAAKVKGLKVTAKADGKKAADARQAVYVEEEGAALCARTGCSPSDAKRTVQAAVFEGDGLLLGTFQLRLADGSVATVADVMARRDELDGSYLYDPIDQVDGCPCDAAWLTWRDGAPKLFSHAHGGKWYRLKASVLTIPLQRGCEADTVDGLAEALRLDGGFFTTETNTFVRVDSAGRMEERNNHALMYDLSRRVACTRVDRNGVPQPQAVPRDAVDQLLSVGHNDHGLPLLRGVITAPTMRADGSILDRLGFDALTGLLLVGPSADSMPRIPGTVTDADLEKALATLWAPFRLFRWSSACRDVGVMLAALLTAAVRPMLPTAPGFGFSAPTAGSGKTMLLQCVATLATGEHPSIQPPVRSADETRKRLYTALLMGATRPICWDNLQEPLGCESLDAFLTSPTYSDRNLGSNSSFSMRNAALFLVTGRNLALRGDTNRRVLLCRLDPGVSDPFTTSFAFDPLEVVTRERLAMVAAALTVIKWGRDNQSGAGKTLGSFSDWTSFVSKPLCELSKWLDANEAAAQRLADQVGLPSAGWCDPVDAISENMRTNDESCTLASLHDLILAAPFSGAFTVHGLLQASTNSPSGLANEVVQMILGECDSRGGTDSQRVGNWLRRSALNVPHGGAVIRKAKTLVRGSASFRVVAA